jgi:acetoacetate decarboxylase
VRFVKTEDEITRIQTVYASCHQLRVKTLTVYFETGPAVIAALLPPPLKPTPNPVAIASVGEVGNSNCVGPYEYASLGVKAQYGDIVGVYYLTTPVSTPEAMTFGRELYGDPRKMAKIIFEEQDEHVWGSAERNEIRFLSMRGRCDHPAPVGRQETSAFHFKFQPRPDGCGFDSPPQLVHVTGDLTVVEARRGRGEVVFRDSPHDPVIDIPVTQVLDAVYTQGHAYTSGRILCDVDADAFLPYAFISTDSAEVMSEGTVLHAQASRRTREGKGEWRKTA